MGIHRKHVNNKTHNFFFIITNFGTHRKYVSFYSHSSSFIVVNFEIWVYRGMKIHFLLVTLKLSWIDFPEIWHLSQMTPFHTTKDILSLNIS